MEEQPDDQAPDRHEPRFAPDPACRDCSGRGWLRTPRGVEECACLLRRRVVHYLTPRYADPAVPWDRGSDPAPLVGKDVLVGPWRLDRGAAGTPLSAVKSFLLRTGARRTHLTATLHEVVQRYLANRQSGGLDELARPDLLVLLFDVDPPNKAYPDLLTWLMVQRRRAHGRDTWALTRYDPATRPFRSRYGDEVADHLLAAFIRHPQPAG